MFDVKVDGTRNCLTQVLKGFLADEEVVRYIKSVQAELYKLRPGFTMITDISQFKPMTPSSVERIEELQRVLDNKGIRRVLRVVDESTIIGMQMRRISKAADARIEVIEFATMADAQEYFRSH